ncbi:Cilia- and flagella-associated protein 58 [Eumeta japonica]|uniref:Cilia-and flagella-associated protein 58 n=1 Tax=Eumeta variegata TaxID=151549 RepID=A0A4C1XCU1_EUMVA|nr:Cilia- and flagella-associated protein 58 [Eumeta japonica]
MLDVKKALDEETLKCRQLMTSLDATRAEKNSLQSSYVEALDEIQDLKQKIKMSLPDQLDCEVKTLSCRLGALTFLKYRYKLSVLPTFRWFLKAFSRAKRTYKLPESGCSSPPVDTCDPRGVASALPAFWLGIGHLIERGLIKRVWSDEGEISYRNSHALNEMQQRKVLLQICIPSSSKQPVLNCTPLLTFTDDDTLTLKSLNLYTTRSNKELSNILRQQTTVKKMMAYQIEQLKEDITEKETSLKSCQSSLGKSNKRGDQLKTELQATQNKLSDARTELAAMTQEQARLNKIIMESDAARNKLLKHVEGLEGERDVLGAQLVRRGDELGLLYKKIRLLEITLHRGGRQYDRRMEDIRLLRLEIIRLRKEKNLLSKGIENMTDLRLEVFNIERELARERLRVKALEQAVQTPLNVHRWRKLHATDPDTVTLYQKMRVLQKYGLFISIYTCHSQRRKSVYTKHVNMDGESDRTSISYRKIEIDRKILNQNETLFHKDRELKETQNLYKAVKDVLAQQPSPDIKHTLTRTQRALTQRTTKLKCLVAELSMRERQITDLKMELQRAEDYKRRYNETLRALDADERRKFLESTPTTEDK